ncbi:hypothetical protein [Pseudodesulfovibrio piezophilus]|uniref:hypothetical protein n=1 Tax=Pseudodesulfovibrio piezophilus TaxID=879567 RepID=UPI00034650C8|nr:hypothetical protein [Pseudodesulfovibrio piezophilus]
MRKIRKLPSGRYRAPKLFIGDIERIVAVLLKYSEDIEIRDGDYVFDSIDELKEVNKGKELDYLTIDSSNPYVYLSVSKNTSLSISSDAPEPIAAFHEIDAILQAAERKRTILNRYSWLFYLLIIPVGYASIKSIMKDSITLVEILWMLPINFAYLAWAYYEMRSLQIKAEVYIKGPEEVTSFLQRNKDSIKVGLIVAVPVAFFSIIGTLIGQKVMDGPSHNVAVESTTSSNATDQDRDK